MFCRAEGRTEADKALDLDWSGDVWGHVRQPWVLHDCSLNTSRVSFSEFYFTRLRICKVNLPTN
jgi:hypothetical protein